MTTELDAAVKHSGAELYRPFEPGERVRLVDDPVGLEYTVVEATAGLITVDGRAIRTGFRPEKLERVS